VSTHKQDTETQRRECLEYLDRKYPSGGYIYTIYDEGDLTSQLPMNKRPELIRMLDDVTPKSTVLVYELDRLARDVLEVVAIYREITKDKKAFVHSLNDASCDELTVTIMGAIAQKQRERTQGKTKDKLSTKRKKGERYSRFLPYGYGLHETKLVPIRVGHEIVMKRGILVPIFEEQQALSLMKQFFAAGMSYHSIARSLTELGYKNREGNPFQKMSIYRILSRIEQTKLEDQLQEEKEPLQSC